MHIQPTSHNQIRFGGFSKPTCLTPDKGFTPGMKVFFESQNKVGGNWSKKTELVTLLDVQGHQGKPDPLTNTRVKSPAKGRDFVDLVTLQKDDGTRVSMFYGEYNSSNTPPNVMSKHISFKKFIKGNKPSVSLNYSMSMPNRPKPQYNGKAIERREIFTLGSHMTDDTRVEELTGETDPPVDITRPRQRFTQ